MMSSHDVVISSLPLNDRDDFILGENAIDTMLLDFWNSDDRTTRISINGDLIDRPLHNVNLASALDVTSNVR